MDREKKKCRLKDNIEQKSKWKYNKSIKMDLNKTLKYEIPQEEKINARQ